MRRGTIVAGAACFAAGIACQTALSLTAARWLWLIAAGLVAAMGAAVRGRVSSAAVTLLLVAWGGWWCALAELRLDDGLDEFIEAGPVTVRGVVVSHPERDGDRVHAVVRLRQVQRGPAAAASRALLRLTVEGGPPLAYGDEVELRAELRRPRPATNPGAFDYKAYLNRQGVTVTAYVAHARHLAVTGRRLLNPLMHAGGALRDRVREGLAASLPPEAAAVAASVVLGDRRPLPAELEEAFRRAGVSHLLAVSGLHVGFLAGFALALLGALRVPPAWRVAATAWLVWLYVFATGARPPAVRAGVMASAALVAGAAGRGRDAPGALAAAAWVLLWHNPLLLSDVSFQLSFAAAAAIVAWHGALARRLRRLPGPLAAGAAVAAAAQLGVTPLLARTFHRLSVVGWAGSVAGSPLASLLVPAGLAAGLVYHVSPEAGRLLGRVAGHAASWLAALARGLGGLPWSSVDAAPPSPAVMAGWWLLWWSALTGSAPRRRRRQAAALAAALLAFGLWTPLLDAWAAPRLTLVFLDVGQGDAVFIRTPEGVTALVDGGGSPYPSGEPDRDPGENVIVPYLRYAGVGVVDVVVNTHPHEDHLQGLLAVLARRRPPLVVDGGGSGPGPSWAEYQRLVGELAPVRWIARAGDVIRLGRDVRLEVLHPGAPMSGTRSDLNNNSLVLRLVYGETAALLTGDVEAEAQLALLRQGADVRADVVKVPHHGSRWALVSAFYEAVGARVAVITVGRNNYGHPSEEVIAALEGMGVRVYRTDANGAVIFSSDGRRWSVRTMQRRRARAGSGRRGGEMDAGRR